jgi:uncharacterized protein (TIRG00374 family)
VLVVVLIGVFYYLVLPQWAASKGSADLLGKVNPLLLVLAVGLEVASLVAYSVMTRVTLPQEPKIGLFTVFRIQLATKSVTNLVPGGSAAGGTLGYRLFTEAGVAPSAAGFSMATVGLGSAVVLNLILWIALLVSIPFNGFNAGYLTAAVVGVILLLAAAALVFLLMEGRDKAEKVLRAVARHVPYVEEDTAARFVHSLADRLYELSQKPELIRRGALWAAANWLLDASALWVFVRAFGETLNPINVIVAYGLAGVLAAIPLTPGGLGVVEGVLIPTLTGFGLARGTATIAVLSWRFAQFWLPIPLGAVAYLSLRFGSLSRGRRLKAVREFAQEAGQGAGRRVWDEETGQYRMVVPETGLQDVGLHVWDEKDGEDPIAAAVDADLEQTAHPLTPEGAHPRTPDTTAAGPDG